MRRVNPRTDDDTLPTALITCDPKCQGERNHDPQYVVTLDGTLSASPAPISSYEWSLLGRAPSTWTGTRQSPHRVLHRRPDHPLTFECVTGSRRVD